MNLNKNLHPRLFILILFCSISIFTSCEKDTDLFAEIMAQNEAQALEDEKAATEDSTATNDVATQEIPEEPIIDTSFDDKATILKAFPSAFGGGSNASGGRGGRIIHVTNLNNSGSGSLREALTATGPRIVVFDISGTIRISSEIYVHDASDLTIAGQTAPEGGITVTGDRILFYKSNNVIIRYLRSRPAKVVGNPIPDDKKTASFLFWGGQDIILDHCSASWAGDKAILFATNIHGLPNRNFTTQKTIIADSHTSVLLGVQSNGDYNSVDNISFTCNLIGNNTTRTPNMSGNGYFEIKNNVIHGWTSKLTTLNGGNSKVNHQGNYYKKPQGVSLAYNRYQPVSGKPEIYSNGNFYSGLLNGEANENNEIIWINTSTNEQLSSDFFVDSPHSGNISNSFPTLTAQEAYDFVINDVGANKYYDNDGVVKTFLDSYDQSVINNTINNVRIEVKNSYSWVLPNLPSNVRPSNYDTDQDGMADAWELRRFGDLTRSHSGDEDEDGYTNIEEFINQVDFY
ncbi:hypothetical protein ACOCEA_16650 [Maribacter sp. CXY002]|uniref:hypothetical protein n=1 Tax=Maribacter luteocoastalis TaxID=3407671 RepID=UPI003B682795